MKQKHCKDCILVNDCEKKCEDCPLKDEDNECVPQATGGISELFKQLLEL